MSRLVDLAEKAKTDDDIRLRINTDPLEVMRSLGIEVEEDFKEAVENQLKALTAGKGESIGVEPMSTPLVSTAPETKPDEQGPKFRTNSWGLVLDLPPSTIDEINRGLLSAPKLAKDILLPAFKAVLSTKNPVLWGIGAIAALWCSIQAGWILVEIAAINLMNLNYKKGVYLTWTWIGLALTVDVPIVTPIKE
ncbi:hypothetical protein D1BOALGB6SA_9287 [Olavius sp. associated proteobacterium Delta 1]|nr:hypothetical protein D1BOALGB6SA_9287 [Olavius sp. associated proteobacterium Delta 1]